MLFHSVKRDRRTHRRAPALSICLGLCLAAVGHAAVTIDPDAVGATDVTPANIVTNPLQPSVDLTVGDTATGALRIDAGSKVESNNSWLGNAASAIGAATVSGAGSTWASTGQLRVGSFGDGTLLTDNGGKVTDTFGWIAYESGSTGVATVSGAGSAWTNSAELNVGFFGEGELHLQAGGKVSNTYGRVGREAGSMGVATVSGAGSFWTNSQLLYVGYFGDGALRVEDGGIVSSSSGRLGQEVGSTGIATVTGAGSVWGSTHTLTVGFAGDGELHVEDGGKVTAPNGWIGYESGSTGAATVTGAGSSWTGQAALYVGYGGAGALTLEDGGRVINQHAGSIGYLAGSTGEATVSGTGSEWASRRDTVVGDRGAGTLVVRDGGLVTTDIDGRIGNQTGSTGEAAVTGVGSRWDITSSFYVGNSGDGTLRVEDGGVVNSFSGVIGVNTGSSGVATISGAGSLWYLRPLSTLNVGGRGEGALRVEAGGEVRNLTGSIGLQSGSKGVATITGAGSRWNNTEYVYVGNSGDGTLRVEDGGAVASRYSYIGAFGSAVGEAVVTGALSQWTLGDLTIGRSGSGKLRVEDGGLVAVERSWIGHLARSTGEAFVSGADSQWTVSGLLQVGGQSDGTLRVEAGGVVTSAEGGVGYSPGSTGVATVTGVGSKWNNSNFLQIGVSADADGELRVEAGGVVSSYRGYLGYLAGSTGAATVTGAGSQWNHSDSFYVGSTGDGTLRVENGGVVTTASFSLIGNSAGSTGLVTVTGAGSQWHNGGAVHVGFNGGGTLLVESGGVVNSVGGSIAAFSGSTGAATVTGAGSQWNHSAPFFIGGEVSLAGGAATLDILDEGQVTVDVNTKLLPNGSVTLGDSGILRTPRLDLTVGDFQMHTGGRLEADAVVGDLVNLSGVVAPHVGVGVMTISGDYDQAANATLEIELGGVGADQFDAIVIAGEATLNGTLEVALLNSFTPAAGDLFTVIDSGVVSGAFATVDFTAASLPAGLEWRVDYYADRVDLLVIEAAPALAGDYNSDGVVNAADYTVWRDGNSPDSSQAEYDLWVDNYGATTATATFNTAPQAAPEPASVIALLLAFLGLMVRPIPAVETESRPR